MDDKKQGKKLNVPNLRFPEFTGEWKGYHTTDFLDFKNGLNPDKRKFGKGIKFISVMDILNNDFITYDKIINSVESNTKEIKDFGVNYGDILFQRSSETLEDVGRANVYLDNKTALFGGFVIRGKKIGEYNPLFFRYLFSSPSVRKSVIVKGAGAQHFNIGQDGLRKVSITIPDLSEQNKISSLLNLIDNRIETQSKIIEDLEKLKSAIIEKSYNQKHPNQKIGDVISQTSTRNRNGNNSPVLSVNNRRGFIEQSEQFEDRLVASEDTSNYKIVRINDFAYNPARINVGSIARLISFKEGIVSPMYICFKTKGEIHPEYLEHFFATRHFYYEMQKRLEGSVRSCLSWEGLCNIPIFIPTIKEQRYIGKQMIVLSDKIVSEKHYLELLKTQKQYLLNQMFI